MAVWSFVSRDTAYKHVTWLADTTVHLQYLADNSRLRQTINTRAAYNERKSEEWRERSRVSDHVFSHARTERVTPERDSGVSKHVQGEDDSSGTLSDISNYITRLEAVQNRLTDLKLSSYKIYDSNKSLS